MLSFNYRKLVPSLFRSSRRKPYRRPRVGECLQRRSFLWLESLETRLAPAVLTQSTGGVLSLALASGNTIGISGTASHLTFTIVSTTLTFTNSSSDTSYAFAASTTGSPVGSTSSAINGTNGPTLTALIIADAGSTGEAIQFGFAGTGCTLPSGATLTVIDSAKLTTFLNNNVNTGTGSQTYGNKITVNGNSTLTGSTVAFAASINDSPANTHDLGVTGDASFAGTVGSTPLKSLSVSGATSINTGSITTQGSQSYSNAVTLGAASVVLTSNAPGTIAFGSTIAGAGDSLTIQKSSGVTFGGAIGSSGNALNALTVKSTGALSLNQNIFATSVSFNSDTGSAGGRNLTVASAITIQADTQSYKAGSNSASGSSVVDFSRALSGTFANTLGIGNPVNFTVSQDGGLNGSEPANTQYFSSTLTGMNLTLESPNGVNPGTAANVAATNLTLLSSDTIFLQTDYTLNSLVATAGAISPTNNAVITTTAGGQSYTGQVTLTTDATFDAASGGTTGTIIISGGVDNNAGSNVTLNMAGSATAIANSSISGVISDQAGTPLVTTGLNLVSGTLVLSGVSTYSGNTNISNGATLTFGALGSLGSAAPFTNVNTNTTGIFDLAGTAQVVGTLTGSGTVRSTGGAGTVMIQNTCTFGGVIQDGTGTTSLSVEGGTFTLSGANTYSGLTSIGNGATLTFSATGRLHGAATFTDVNTNTSGTLDVAGTSQSMGHLSGTGTVKSTGASGAVMIESTSAFAGMLTDGTGGTLSVSVEGSGTILTLSGTSNDYSGQTIISASCVLKVGASNATSANSAVTLNGTGTLDLDSFDTIIGGLSDDATGNATVTNSSATTAATLTLRGTGGNFTGTIHGGASAATSLTVDLASGVLNLTNATLSLGTFTLTAGTVTAPNSTHSFKVSGDWTNNGGTFTANGGTVDFTADSGIQALDSGGQGFAAITHSGSGVLQLVNHGLSVTSSFTNAAGTFDLNGQAWTMTGASFSNPGNVQLEGFETITGLTQDTAQGAWTYVGNNAGTTYTLRNFGPTSYFVLIIQDGNANQDTFQATADVGVAGFFYVAGGTYDANGHTTTVAGLTKVDGGTYLASTANQNLNGDLTVSNTRSPGTFTGGTGTVSVPNVNMDGGTLVAPSTVMDVTGNFSITGGTFTANGGTVDFTGSATQTLDSNGQSFNNVSHTGAGVLQLVNNPLTVGGNLTNGAGAGSFDALANHLGVMVIGQATLGGGSFLAATLSVGSATVINTAAITTTGTQTYAGDVILGTGTTLTGTIVTFHNHLTLGADATHATETLKLVGSLVLSTTSTLTSTFAGTGPGQFGHILVSGNTTYGNSTLAVNYSGFTPAAGDNFDIVSNGGSSLLQFANAPDSDIANLGGVAYLSTYSGSAGGSDFILSVLTPQQRFVEALYHDELGRPGNLNSPVDAGFWVSLLTQGTATTADVAARVVQSSEGRDHLVKGWYQTYLGRAPQGGEELGWVGSLQQGQTDEQVLSQILASDEFFADAQNLVATGTLQERYVRALYQLVLGRTASDAEVANWDPGLPQSGSAAVALAFLTSQEYRTDLFTSYYTRLLHRAPDAVGLQAWVSSNLDSSQVRIGFEASPEFFLNG
jgi:autotransporter-associated beta strand protein